MRKLSGPCRHSIESFEIVTLPSSRHPLHTPPTCTLHQSMLQYGRYEHLHIPVARRPKTPLLVHRRPRVSVRLHAHHQCIQRLSNAKRSRRSRHRVGFHSDGRRHAYRSCGLCPDTITATPPQHRGRVKSANSFVRKHTSKVRFHHQRRLPHTTACSTARPIEFLPWQRTRQATAKVWSGELCWAISSKR